MSSVPITRTNGVCQGIWVPSDTWTTDSTFDKYDGTALNPAIPTPTPGYDVYRAPGTNGPDDPGTGYQAFNADGTPGPDYGRGAPVETGFGQSGRALLVWLVQTAGSPVRRRRRMPEQFRSRTNTSGRLRTASAWTEGIGDTLTVDNQTGNATGPTNQAVYDATGDDDSMLLLNGIRTPPGIRRQRPSKTVVRRACALTACTTHTVPGLSPVPVFSLDAYLAANPNGSGETITVTNIFGFFILTTDQAEALGRGSGQRQHWR